MLLTLSVLSLLRPADAILPTRKQYAELNAMIEAVKLEGLETPEQWSAIFPLDQHFLFSTKRCEHVACITSAENRTMRCSTWVDKHHAVEYVQLRYQAETQSFQLASAPHLLPNHEMLFTFAQCFHDEPWVLPPAPVRKPSSLLGDHAVIVDEL
jgi:hypothetical protein